MQSFNVPVGLAMPELPTYIDRVETAMRAAIQSDNPILRQPIERILSMPGKRLRPSLVLAISSRGRGISEVTISSAAAVELVHLASLVHDDISDHGTNRYGLPTINSKEGSDTALLAGDYLLAKACELALMAAGPEMGQLVAATIADMCSGQALELADRHNLQRTVEAYYRAVDGKTASLFAAACQIGGLCGRLSHEDVQNLTRYGRHFGIALQLINDLHEATSQPSVDIREGIYTLPVIVGLQGSQRIRLHKLLEGKNSDNSAVAAVMQSSGVIDKVIEHVQTQVRQAAGSLANLPQMQHLTSLLEQYMQWALYKYS